MAGSFKIPEGYAIPLVDVETKRFPEPVMDNLRDHVAEGLTVAPEMVEGAVEVVLETHVQAPEPHPAYDDIPNLTLIFENGLI